MAMRIAPKRLPYVLSTLVMGATAAVWFAGYVKTWNSGYLLAGILCLVLLGCVFLWVSHYRILLSGDRMTLGRFSWMQRSFRREEIKEWYSIIGLLDRHGRVGPLARMVIEPTPASGKRPVVIPLKFFAPIEIRLLERFLPGQGKVIWDDEGGCVMPSGGCRKVRVPTIF